MREDERRVQARRLAEESLCLRVVDLAATFEMPEAPQCEVPRREGGGVPLRETACLDLEKMRTELKEAMGAPANE